MEKVVFFIGENFNLIMGTMTFSGLIALILIIIFEYRRVKSRIQRRIFSKRLKKPRPLNEVIERWRKMREAKRKREEEEKRQKELSQKPKQLNY